MTNLLEQAQAMQNRLTELRRTIHQQPELGFEEVKTSALVADTLHDLGVETQTGFGKTGVVARLGNGDGPVIGIRADMDALPILEANDVPYKSQVPGKMHACGHDAHTTILLGAAMLLKDQAFNGEIRLLFQPSEERSDAEGFSGAQRMIEEGAIKGLDAVIALHVEGAVERGKVLLREGPISGNTDSVSAKIFGRGGHGAKPHEANDPIFMLIPVLSALHGIVARRVKPIEPAVVTVGRVTGGTAHNVIPDYVELEMTLRSLSLAVREQLIAEVERALSLAETLGGRYELHLKRGYPSVVNDAGVVSWLRGAATDLLGAENILQNEIIMGGEDFSFMAQASRGAMMRLGVKDPAGPPRYVHHPEFDIDEAALPIGAAVLAETALRFVRGQYS